MGTRRKSRELALQMLFQADMGKQSLEEVRHTFWNERGSVGADVRGFYQALGIELPGWAQREASVGCFANPDAHAHGDRDPSCSVNVETGAWH